MQVSVLSIIFMAVSAIVSIGVPVGLFVFIYKKYNAKIIPMLIGAAAFIIFALVIEASIHNIVLKTFALREKPVIFIIYGIFMAGIFEETARFISFNILKKNYTGINTALSYGIGHGGIEAVLLAGASMIVFIVFCILINTGNIELITEKLQGEKLIQIETIINTLLTTEPKLFLVSGLERFFAIIIQISLSVTVFYSVYCKGKIWLFPLAILLHALIDLPAVVLQVGILKSVFLVECIIGLCAVILAIFAFKLYKKLKTESQEADISPNVM